MLKIHYGLFFLEPGHERLSFFGVEVAIGHGVPIFLGARHNQKSGARVVAIQ